MSTKYRKKQCKTKWVLLLGTVLLSTSCVYSSANVVEYRQVGVEPVVGPAMMDLEAPKPLDVTNTSTDIYYGL